MWRRWIRDLEVEFYWIKRDLFRRWHLDTPLGIVGILALISGILLLIIMGEGIAHVFRSYIPWVAGSRAGALYWESIGFGFKASIIFLMFSGSLILFFMLKFFDRR